VDVVAPSPAEQRDRERNSNSMSRLVHGMVSVAGSGRAACDWRPYRVLGGGVARSGTRTRAATPGAARPLILIEPDSAVCCVFFKAAALQRSGGLGTGRPQQRRVHPDPIRRPLWGRFGSGCRPAGRAAGRRLEGLRQRASAGHPETEV